MPLMHSFMGQFARSEENIMKYVPFVVKMKCILGCVIAVRNSLIECPLLLNPNKFYG